MLSPKFLFLRLHSPLSIKPALLHNFTTTITSSDKSVSNRTNAIVSSSVRRKEDEGRRKRLAKRTRSEKEFDEAAVLRYGREGEVGHLPVMVGEVLEVFRSVKLRSFVDCTMGAGGHSSAIIQAHPEMKSYIGLDVDPTAHEQAQARINGLVNGDDSGSTSDLKVHTFLKNYRDVKHVLHVADEELANHGVDGILMDLGMSSMQVNNAERGFSVLFDGPLDMRMNPQASLKAEDILNSWPDVEVGRILREYGEESKWYSLQNRIIKARQQGGLHSTGELVRLIQKSTSLSKDGRQGWIKTATRVFQALRIAVNDELNTLKDSLYASFDCLAPGGRLAVISFHSLEDRIVKQTFLDIIKSEGEEEDYQGMRDTLDIIREEAETGGEDDSSKELWIKRMIEGLNGTILTKRPITPCQEEEKLNRRSRSAKLRVIQKN